MRENYKNRLSGNDQAFDKSKLHAPVIFQIHNSKSSIIVAEINVWDNN